LLLYQEFIRVKLSRAAEVPSNITHGTLTKAEILALVSNLPLKFQPSEFHAYDNIGYYLLGLMLEKVTGQPYGDLLRDRLQFSCEKN